MQTTVARPAVEACPVAEMMSFVLPAQSLYVTYNPDGDAFTLQEAIIVFGIVELILSQLPDIHSLRFLNIFCTFCTIAFAVICFSVSITNGM